MAALMTGIIFGGGSVLFADVTEGLGCLLGGFSLSMWFLVLKPGGLLPSTAGKVILISSFTLGAFGLYISHYTRPYGLIGSISFAGATVIVLGVDCFSRAGLKEFWLYIWDLNEDLFPFHYSEPYPITRGIRVEIACIIILFLLGIMSQMKIWKIIKERRDQKAAAQLKEEERRDKAEENLGRKLEEGNGQELALWEAVYGDKESTKRSKVDSGVGTDEPGSLRKVSISAIGTREIRNSGTESIEMSNLEGTTNNSSGRASLDGLHGDTKTLTVRIASDEKASQAPSAGPEHSKYLSPPSMGASVTHRFHEPAQKPTVLVSFAEASSAKGQREDKSGVKEPEAPVGPKVVPLPFKIPEPETQIDDDLSSIATFAPSEHIPARSSNRFSGGSLLRSLSRRSQRHSRNEVPSEEELIADDDDDRASSVAATIDTDRDSDMGEAEFDSGNPLPSDHGFPTGAIAGDHLSALESSAGPGPKEVCDSRLSNGVSEEGLETRKDDSLAGAFAREKRPSSLGQTLTMPSEDPDVDKSAVSLEVSDSIGKTAKLGGLPPEGTSKVVMAYRTNEWAKHLEAAETPELPALDDLNSGTNSEWMDTATTKEAAATVYFKQLQQTPLTAEPAPILRDRAQEGPISRSVSKDPLPDHHTSQRPTLTQRQSSSGRNVERSVSQLSLQSSQSKKETSSSSTLRLTSSQLSLNPSRGLRSSSTPLTSSPLIGSPIEEGVESSFAPRFTPSAKHLMSHRDSLMRNKPSSTSLNLNSSSTSLNRNASTASLNPNASSVSLNRNASSSLSPHPAASSDSLPSQSAHLVTLDQDNIPLSQRKSFLQQKQQQQQRLSQHPSRTSLLSRHPHRTSLGANNNPRESTLSAWRSSLRVDSSAQEAVQEIEARRSEMLSEKRQASNSQQWATLMEAGRRDSGLLDRGMRRGDMQEKHREAMRRMQAGANKHV